MVKIHSNYRKTEVYKYKLKKLLCAAALGMTLGTPWDGLDNASGGYIILKKWRCSLLSPIQ